MHGDRESGWAGEDAERAWAKRNVRVTLTKGRDPQANGNAETTIGDVSGRARRSVAYLARPAGRPVASPAPFTSFASWVFY